MGAQELQAQTPTWDSPSQLWGQGVALTASRGQAVPSASRQSTELPRNTFSCSNLAGGIFDRAGSRSSRSVISGQQVDEETWDLSTAGPQDCKGNVPSTDVSPSAHSIVTAEKQPGDFETCCFS